MDLWELFSSVRAFFTESLSDFFCVDLFSSSKLFSMDKSFFSIFGISFFSERIVSLGFFYGIVTSFFLFIFSRIFASMIISSNYMVIYYCFLFFILFISAGMGYMISSPYKLKVNLLSLTWPKWLTLKEDQQYDFGSLWSSFHLSPPQSVISKFTVDSCRIFFECFHWCRNFHYKQ